MFHTHAQSMKEQMESKFDHINPMSFESLPSSISERKHIDIKPEQEYNSSPFKQSPPCIEVSDHTEDLVQKKFPKDDYDEQYKRRFEPQSKPQIVE